jgi:hypothetical protein
VAVAVVVLVVSVLRPGGYLPQPFVIALLPFCALLAAGVLDGAVAAVAARLPSPRAGVAAGTALVVLALAVVLWPSWHNADSYATSTNQNGAQHQAASWVESHVNHRARVLVDDTYYVDLVDSGFRPRFGAVWFYKLDFSTNLDPSVQRTLPNGWRSFDYVISSPVMRSALAQNKRSMQEVRSALANSRTVRSFGSGSNVVEVRRVVGGRSGLLPAPATHPKPHATAAKHKRGRLP